MTNKFEEVKRRSEKLKEATFQDLRSEVVECSDLVRQLDPNRRRPWISDVVWQMFEDQNGKCALTGEDIEPNFEVDHIIPVSYGGGNERENLRLVNRKANRSRGNRGVSPAELLRYLESRYMNR